MDTPEQQRPAAPVPGPTPGPVPGPVPGPAAAPAAAPAPASASSPGGRATTPAVAQAWETLGTVGEQPLDERPAAFTAVHGALQQALASIDDA